MPKYHLAIDNKKDGYKDLDISSFIDLNKIGNAETLEAIVSFTTGFNTIKSLKLKLLNSKLIDNADLNKNLTIYYKYNKQDKKLRYGVNGISLNKDLSFFDTEDLEDYLISKKDDLTFINKLCNHYRSTYNQGPITMLRRYLTNIKIGLDDGDQFKLYSDAIKWLIESQTTTLNKTTGEVKTNYKGLRDLAMYVSHLDNEIKLELEDAYHETIKNNIKHEDDSSYSKYYEDGFPPNSEELKKLREYLESLDCINSKKR